MAIGEVWMRVWQFMGDLALMDGNWAIPFSPHTPLTPKALVQIRINEVWRYGGWGDECMAQDKERAVEVFCVTDLPDDATYLIQG